jgi:hypothetical protein
MSIRCKVFGHKWQEYKEDVPHVTSPVTLAHRVIPSYTFAVNTEFRYCPRCFTNQVRVAHSGDEKVDWRDVALNLEQLRDKKLQDLGI